MNKLLTILLTSIGFTFLGNITLHIKEMINNILENKFLIYFLSIGLILIGLSFPILGIIISIFIILFGYLFIKINHSHFD